MSVASKNLYDLLGNDDDGTDAPSAPVKTVDKTSTHTAKRNTDGIAPSKAPVTGGNRRGGGYGGGNDAVFRDRNAGSDRNRSRPTDEAPRGGARGGRDGRGRGGRGGRFRSDKDDRHTKGLPSGSEKQAAQSWGATEGDAELKDEQAGEAIAQTEAKDAAAEAAAEDPEEPEDKHITLDAYLAQQAEKRLALEADALKLRKANEGTKDNKKWANAKALAKEDDEDFISGTGGKAKRERERKVKQVVEIDQTWVETDRSAGGARGGRGGPRGGRGAPRGEFRGGRGEGRGAPRGAPRGDARGGRGGPSPRGGAGLNTSDERAFPSLGA